MIQYKNLVIIPSYHSNLDFVFEVRKQFYIHPPDIIVVEFPNNLQNKILAGIQRLPKISIVLYFDELLNQQLYIPITPGDSLIEAIRLGLEYGIPVEFIDLFVKNYDPEILALPDSKVLDYISIDEFYSILKRELNLDGQAKKKYLNQKQRQKQIEEDNQKEGNLLESESRINTLVGKDAQNWLLNADEIDIIRNYYMASRLHELMINNPNDQILVILGVNHWEPIQILLENEDFSSDIIGLSPEVSAEVYNVLEKDLPKITLEPPNILFQYEYFRKRQKIAIDKFDEFQNSELELIKLDYFKAISTILQRAFMKYQNEYDEFINLHKQRSLNQYMLNLALIEGMMKPRLFEIVLASKSIVNDDFAWIVWEECKWYPLAKEDLKMDSLPFTDKGIFLHGKYFKLRRNIPLKIQKIKLPLKPKQKEFKKGEWRKAWNHDRWDLVSHIPEDVFEENYFQHVRQRSLTLLKDNLTRTHEFTSTLLDGIDFRETLRNWPLKQKIYVKEEHPVKGEVDAVIIIFDPDDEEFNKFPHEMMWYAEHDNESDLAFYSTFPGVELVGPGISRIELGGVASFFPPRGVPNIWSDEFVKQYPMVTTKPERLLMASMVFAQKKIVTFVSDIKPKSIFYQIARMIGIQIHHIPLDRFNPVSLRSLRNLHILAGKHRRAVAHKYIKKRRI